jgi:hypothetical protein
MEVAEQLYFALLLLITLFPRTEVKICTPKKSRRIPFHKIYLAGIHIHLPQIKCTTLNQIEFTDYTLIRFRIIKFR